MSKAKCLYCGCQIYDPIAGLQKIHDPEKCAFNPANQTPPDCSNHKKDLFGETDMKVVAEAISNLHYESFVDLLGFLEGKMCVDAMNDKASGRGRLAGGLFTAAEGFNKARKGIEYAWQISKPFMNQTQDNGK